MTFPLASPSHPLVISRPPLDEYDPSSRRNSAEILHRRSNSQPRISFAASDSGDYLFPPTAASSLLPSRSVSPLPQFFPPSGLSSSSSSDAESEPGSPLLVGRRNRPFFGEEPRGWWSFGSSRRRRRGSVSLLRKLKKSSRRVFRHPLFPKQPITIVLALLLLSTFAVFLTLLLIYILNPDKEPLPWRAYCAMPSTSTSPPDEFAHISPFFHISYPSNFTPVVFPPDNFDSLPPAGVFLGVFSMDSAFERRMLVRSTWASHPRSRDGAGDGDDGQGTSRTVVRFILGQPRKNYERSIKYEMELYNDIVIIPIPENMNSGKTHAYFSWASTDAWVPPLYFDASEPQPRFSYSNMTVSAPNLAPHDPEHARRDQEKGRYTPWVRPDYVLKCDDDSFVMLAELEARLRLELHAKPHSAINSTFSSTSMIHSEENSTDAIPRLSSTQVHDHSVYDSLSPPPPTHPNSDPLIYWGYLVKNRFMGGELYGLSWSLVDWAANDLTVKTLTKGAEDKQTAKWIRAHPRPWDIRWASERCWIYDHPRAGTVYSHGFLFPSEATRVRQRAFSHLDKHPENVFSPPTPESPQETPNSWTHSSVTTFGIRYQPPLPDLTPQEEIEALVEGSDMSMLSEGSSLTPEYAWLHREGRRKRYEGKRVGGTVVVHFIKKNMWFMETALAMLEGEEYSDLEKPHERESGYPIPFSVFSRHRRN